MAAGPPEVWPGVESGEVAANDYCNGEGIGLALSLCHNNIWAE